MDQAAIALIFFAFGTVCLAFVLGGNIFEQVVCVPNWRRPCGLRTWRAFAGNRHPGHFFLVLAPTALLGLTLGTVLGWSSAPARNPYSLFATIAVLAALIFTRAFFIPRNRLLFLPATATDDEARATALLEEWIVGNRLRVLVSMSALVGALFRLGAATNAVRVASRWFPSADTDLQSP